MTSDNQDLSQAPEDPAPLEGASLLEELARDARPADISDVGKRKLIVEWENATNTLARAKQMVIDAVAYQETRAREIVKKLGRGHFRHNGKLYSVSAKGSTVYLRELVKKEIP